MMRRKVSRDYRSAFYKPPPDTDKKLGLTFHWQAPKKGPLIVFHPYFRFDPFSADARQIEIIARPTEHLEATFMGNREFEPFVPPGGYRVLILHESYRVDADVLQTIRNFIELYPDLLQLSNDEDFWWDTGFWSSRSGEDNYIGISESSARQYFGSGRDGEFAYILCNTSTIIALTTKTGHDGTWVDVYLNNRFLPFAEARRAIQRTLDGTGPWARLEMDVDDEEKVLGGIKKKKWQDRRHEPSRFLDHKPLAVVKGALNTYPSIVMEWKFGSTPWEAFDSLRYVLASHGGTSWDESDFTPQTQLEMRWFHPRFLKNCVVLDCSLEVSRIDDSWDQLISDAITARPAVIRKKRV